MQKVKSLKTVPLLNRTTRKKLTKEETNDRIEANKTVLLRSILTTNNLVSAIDDMEKLDIYRHSLSRAAKAFQQELEAYSDAVWSTMSPTAKSVNIEAQVLFDKCIDEAINHLIF